MTLKRVLPAVLVLLLAGAGVGATRAPRQGDVRNFWALNNTGREIREFYVSSHDATNWGNDVLGQATLPSGMGTFISFNPKSETGCTFDFKLVFTDGSNDTYQQGRDICSVYAVQFNQGESFGLVRQP